MDKFSKFKSSIENEKRTLKGGIQTSNPMAEKVNSDLLLNDYTQTTPRQKYDQDIAEILEIVRILNNMVPTRMPEYSFDIEEINGEIVDIYGTFGYATCNSNINKLYFTHNGVSYLIYSDSESVATLIEVASGMEYIEAEK